MPIMNAIDPSYSRPFDVHRWSDHPEARKLSQMIWNTHFAAHYSKAAGKVGAKGLATKPDQLHVLILDLYVAWWADPRLSIGVPLSNTQWHAKSRYNALHLSREIPKFVHRLHEVGLIDMSPGSFTAPGAPSNRNSRIRASEHLRVMFRKARFGSEDIYDHPEKECIILRELGDKGHAKRPVEYEDTPEIVKMRTEVRAYNELLQRHHIDIPELENPWVERAISKGARAGEVTRIPIGSSNMFVHRVFNRGRWDMNGRFWGGWWQQIGSDMRKKICIDGVPTVEIDFTAIHLAILYSEKGLQIAAADPYLLPNFTITDMPASNQRKLVKNLVLMAINAKDRPTAYNAFRQSSATGSREKSMKNTELAAVLDAFIAAHPCLANDLCSDQGIRLMHVDSQIAEIVIDRCTRRLKIPILCVHDSFVARHDHAMAIFVMMILSARTVTGCRLEVKGNYPGLIKHANPGLPPASLPIPALTATPGYLARQRQWQELAIFRGLLEE